MSSAAPLDTTNPTAPKRKNKKKNRPKKLPGAGDAAHAGGNANNAHPRSRDDHINTGDPDLPDPPDLSAEEPEEPDTPVTEGNQVLQQGQSLPQANGHAGTPSSNGRPVTSSSSSTTSLPVHPDTSAKLEAMSQEREALRAEVEQLRRQLESLQSTHDSNVARLRTDLDESEAAKEHAETQYQTLLGRVEKIKETLGERLKRDKAELEEANARIEELETQNEELQGRAASLEDELQESTRELTSLRSRSNLSQQNWLKEKDDLARQVQHFRHELESTSSAMSEWETIAMEERSMRESLTDKVSDLEEQLTSVRDAHERAAEERDSSSQTIDGLQRALQEIQDARRKELRDLVESSEEQLLDMKKRVEEADKRVADAEGAKETLSKEVERTAPFEKEVREKNLLIGKLRHEGIILNDHLTKALRYLKKTKPDEQVDRQIVSNYFLQFVALDRADPKRFQILQVIAGYLNWTDEQKEQAGLARPGASHSSLRLPTSPFHRTPSTPTLGAEFFSDTAPPSGKESLADLWAGFLERSVEEGSGGGGAGSRKDSVSSQSTVVTGTTGAAAAKPDGKTEEKK